MVSWCLVGSGAKIPFSGEKKNAPARNAAPGPPGLKPKGVRAGAGTPTDPKSHLFVTKWVAIPPFSTSGPASCTEFRRGSRRDSPTPSISIFFSTIFDPKSGFLRKHRFLKMVCPQKLSYGAPGAKGLLGPDLPSSGCVCKLPINRCGGELVFIR